MICFLSFVSNGRPLRDAVIKDKCEVERLDILIPKLHEIMGRKLRKKILQSLLSDPIVTQ